MEDVYSTDMPTGNKNAKKKGSICLLNCHSPIVCDVAKSLGMNIVKCTDQWDLCWCDAPLDIKKAKDLKKYQKTNHFPGMSQICRKDALARNLNKMINHFPDDYNFFPKTWYLPSDYLKLKAYTNKCKNSTYILKPVSGCRGTGIYLTKSIKQINKFQQMICQLYISKPLLIDNYKFDMRLYILISSCDPLKIYVYNDGLVRLGTVPYTKPTEENLKNLFMHLTNYSVNKHSKMYVDNEMVGSKRRIATLNNWLSNNNYDVKKIWNEIDDVIIKTMILAYPIVKWNYQTYFSGHKYTPACFEILGFDILLDENCKPHLLEVNHSPDLHTDTAIDKLLKHELLTDTFTLLQLDTTLKKIVSIEDKWKTEQQIKSANYNICKQRMLACKENFEKQNEIWESENMGNYRLVLSEKNSHLYKQYFYLNESALYQNNSSLKKKSSNVRQKKIEIEKVTSTIRTTNKLNEKNINTFQNSSLLLSLKTNNSLINTIHNETLNLKSKELSIMPKWLNKIKIKSINQTSDQILGITDLVSRIEIERIKKLNKKRFPKVQSRLFNKHCNKKCCFREGWNAETIDYFAENMRLDIMAVRREIIFNLDIKEHIYMVFAKLNNIRKCDCVDYDEYQKNKESRRIKPYFCNIINTTFK